MPHHAITRRTTLMDGALCTGRLTDHRRDGAPLGVLHRRFTLDEAPLRPPATAPAGRDAPQEHAGARYATMDEDFPPLQVDIFGLGTFCAQVLATLGPHGGTQTGESLSMRRAREVLDTSALVLIAAAWREAQCMRQAAQLAQWAAAHDICTLALGPMPDVTAHHQYQQAQAGLALLRPWARCLLTLPAEPGRPAGLDHTGGVAACPPEALRAGQAIEGLIDFLRPGLVCVDLADITCLFRGAGTVMVGVGQATGTTRALTAAHRAMAQAWPTSAALAGVQAVLVTIRGSLDMCLEELHIAAHTVMTALPTEASWLFGGLHDAGLHDTVRVTLVAMGT